jgi:hypothetical protein
LFENSEENSVPVESHAHSLLQSFSVSVLHYSSDKHLLHACFNIAF